MTNLVGPRIKLTRAARHIDELRDSAAQFLSSNPFSIHSTEESNGDLVWRVRFDRQVPLEWSAIVGDAVHNIRSALDLLAWQLVEANGGQPSRDTCFPIGQAVTPQFDAAMRRALQGASSRALKLIQRLRPYGGGNRVLAQLHGLDIIDKHRLVLVVGAANKQLIIKSKMKVPWSDKPVEFPPFALNPADRQFPLEDGEVVFGVCAAARAADSMSEHAVVFELAFGDNSEVRGHALIPTLEEMHGYVARVIGMCEKHLNPPPGVV